MRGLGSYILYKGEATYGTKPTSTYDIGYIKSGSRTVMQPTMTPVNCLSSSRRIDKVGNNPFTKSVSQVQGTLNFDLTKTLKPLMKLAFYDTGTNNSSFTPLNENHESSSFTIQYKLGGENTKHYEQVGCFVSGYSISIPNLDSPVGFNLNILGKQETLATGEVSGIPNEKAYNVLFPASLAKLELRKDSHTSGENWETLEYNSFNLDVNNNLQYQNYLSSTGYNEKPPRIGVREMTGNINFRFKRDKMDWFADEVLSQNVCSLKLTMTSEEGNDFKIELPNVYFNTGHLGNLPEDELILQTSYVAIGKSENTDAEDQYDIKVTY